MRLPLLELSGRAMTKWERFDFAMVFDFAGIRGGHRANQAYDEKSSILGKQLHIPDDCVMSARSCVAPPGQWRFDDEMSEHSGRSRHSSRAVREPLRPHGAGRPWMKVSENT